MTLTSVTVAERPDCTYNIFVGDSLKHEGVERRDLKAFLYRYVVESHYDEIIKQLAARGKARVEISLGKSA